MANKAQLHKPAIHGTMATNAIENQGKAEPAEEAATQDFQGKAAQEETAA